MTLAKRRVRRGECIRCGYVLNGAKVCPDCGASEKRIRRSPRLRKTVKWCSLVVSALLLVTWIGSCWFLLVAAGSNRAVVMTLAIGAVRVQYFEPVVRTGTLRIKFQTFSKADAPIWKPSAEFTRDSAGAVTGFFMIMPLWVPFLIAATCAGLVWRMDIRIARRAGIACANCDYEISGLVNVPNCPECGAGIPLRSTPLLSDAASQAE